MQSLFNGIVKMSANITGLSGEGVGGGAKASQLQCLLQPNNAQSECLESGDNADHSILTDLLQLGINEDMEPYTRLALEEENELETSLNTTSHSQLQLKTASLASPKIRPPSLFEISFSQGPSNEPEDGKLSFEKKKNTFKKCMTASLCFIQVLLPSLTRSSKKCHKIKKFPKSKKRSVLSRSKISSFDL